ncbi:ABC transporter ATP-binding protein [Bradyrhizobium sp. NBAIM03]|uniref:ABC transporter ATP-binding protein n=1 Tax=Bradyrhizobium sp. NBAIM03 TaxID=2793816 RepID=UPI001CD343AF|nr:ABC transporter ATP-binding protein [Bradyrhizobium sp. NBAIM03]
MTEVLRIRDLTVEIASSDSAVNRIGALSATFTGGRLYSVIGPSGIGKTSLCLALIGWQRPNLRITGGDTSFLGRSLTGMAPPDRQALWGRDILYIPQSSATTLVSSRGVVDQLAAFPGDTSSQRIERRHLLRSAFDRLDIPGFNENRYPHQYSGGQLQRILVSSLFCAAPRLVMLDEPTSSLQPALKSTVMTAIKARIQEIGAAAIVVTHELAFFEALSDGTIDLARHLKRPLPTQAATSRQKDRNSIRALAPEDRPTPLDSNTGESPPRHAVPLRVDRLSVHAPSGRSLVADVSFSLGSGSCIGLVGPSGAGKTTVLRALLGQHRDSSGEILVGGRRLPLHYSARTTAEKRVFEYVPQSVRLHLNPALTIAYLIGRRLRQAGEAGNSNEAAKVLDSIFLPTSYLPKRLSELSGGECQRLGIALALASRPRILLLDEVTASLDSANGALVVELLRKVRDHRSVSMLFVSHQPDMVARLADEVVEMRAGRVLSSVISVDAASPPTTFPNSASAFEPAHSVGRGRT